MPNIKDILLGFFLTKTCSSAAFEVDVMMDCVTKRPNSLLWFSSGNRRQHRSDPCTGPGGTGILVFFAELLGITD